MGPLALLLLILLRLLLRLLLLLLPVESLSKSSAKLCSLASHPVSILVCLHISRMLSLMLSTPAGNPSISRAFEQVAIISSPGGRLNCRWMQADTSCNESSRPLSEVSLGIKPGPLTGNESSRPISEAGLDIGPGLLTGGTPSANAPFAFLVALQWRRKRRA